MNVSEIMRGAFAGQLFIYVTTQVDTNIPLNGLFMTRVRVNQSCR